MKHIHKSTGLEFEVGKLDDFDMTVITFWPNEDEDELVSPVIVNYYFGDYDESATDDFIDMYLEKEHHLETAVKVLEGVFIENYGTMEESEAQDLKDCIEAIKEMI